MEQFTNRILLRGDLVALPEYSHENHGRKFYRFFLEVPRLSGAIDTLPIVAQLELVEALDLIRGQRMTVEGQIRSHNNTDETGRHLMIFVFANALAMEDGEPINDVSIEGLLCRDEAVLERIQSTYRPYCASIAGRILGDPETVREVCADVWLRLWQSIPPNRPDNLRMYIGRLSRNRALQVLEKEQARKRSAVCVQLEELSEVLPDRFRELDPERLALRQIIQRFLRELPKEKRVIFLRRYWYGDSVEEIADRIGCKSSRITGILYRTRQELRKKLEQEEIMP